MAMFRNVSTSFWGDSKIVDDFTPEDKYFWLYILTNPHTNLIGCYEISVKQMANELGYSKDSVENLISRFENVHKVVKYDRLTKELIVLNWSKYNWSCSPKLCIALFQSIPKVKNDEFYNYLAEILNNQKNNENKLSLREEIDTVPIGYPYPMDTTISITSTITNTNTDSITSTITDSVEKQNKFGEYGWIKLTNTQYSKLCNEFDKCFVDQQIKCLDEYVQSNGNKNKYKDWNLVLRKSIREEWFFKKIPTQSSIEDEVKKRAENHKKRMGIL